uniref:Isopenicillin N synthase-like Fe(2+) 2OG dioxygenase domain-containing protein n=1 Tax=Octactis speculum TaxID=3111310 RepID=A0A7S2DB15_9STRA|mmetsp:Transcript_46291/g.62986  ORF Transcript_46291/g.62986 Transcript_46291/m.62986 type:complete len:101 (+) Transcript_46291:342-644(+)
MFGRDILVNLGDMLSRWTNGRYRSTVHRVMLNGDECDRAVPRHSVAFFANPSYCSMVECFESCCAPTKGMPPAQYEKCTVGKCISGRLGLMYEEPSEIVA